jgi:phosphoglucomutase
MMKNFRENPPKELAGSLVEEVKILKNKQALPFLHEKKVMNEIPQSNVLIYYTQDGTKVCVRPSGTEPKLNSMFQ